LKREKANSIVQPARLEHPLRVGRRQNKIGLRMTPSVVSTPTHAVRSITTPGRLPVRLWIQLIAESENWIVGENSKRGSLPTLRPDGPRGWGKQIRTWMLRTLCACRLRIIYLLKQERRIILQVVHVELDVQITVILDHGTENVVDHPHLCN